MESWTERGLITSVLRSKLTSVYVTNVKLNKIFVRVPAILQLELAQPRLGLKLNGNEYTMAKPCYFGSEVGLYI